MAQSNFKPRHKTHQTKEFSHRKEWLKLYETPEWKAYRVKYLKENPLCYACGKKSEVTDHLIPHQGHRELFELRQNHIPLCKSCHNTVTAKFDRYHVHGKPVDKKAKYLKDLHDSNGLTFMIKVLPSYR